MKNKFKLLALFGLSLLTSSVVSCSSFFGDDGYVIASHSVSVDPTTGNTLLTIVFSSEEVEPLTISIPKGISGDDGVGIKKVTPVYEENRVVITIEYTDESIENTVLSIPFGEKGDDGKGIKEVNVESLENGDITIQFVYTDETIGDLITIPKGKDGNGIKAIVPSYDPLTKVTTITVMFTDDTMSPQVFEIKDGEDGVSIVSVTYSEEYSDENNYCLVITYSDGYVTNRSDSIYLPRPKSTVWYRGASDPLTTLGKVGDFYLNITNGNVYYKVDSSTWEYQFSMKGESTSVTSEYSTVLFDPNGGTFSDSSTMAFASTIKGTPIDLSDIPTPTYADHTFLGWYTTPTYNVNAGKLTDLTPVFKKTLTVYAWWEANI